jgi:hypothetical protein
VRALRTDRILGWLLVVSAAGLLVSAAPGPPGWPLPALGLVGAGVGRVALARGRHGDAVRKARGLRRTLVRELLATALHRRRNDWQAAGDAYERAGRASAALEAVGAPTPLSADARLRWADRAAAVLARMPRMASALAGPPGRDRPPERRPERRAQRRPAARGSAARRPPGAG